VPRRGLVLQVPQELSNEWSCQYASTILNLFGNFYVLPLVTEVTISYLKRVKPTTQVRVASTI
jgi:hypothetical protein